EAAVAAAPRARACRVPDPARHRHAPCAARGRRRGVPHLLREARRVHQARDRGRRGLRRRTMTDAETPYVAGPARRPVDRDALRARIPGWGADLDPADRPSYPREVYDPAATGAHWDLPEAQPELRPRERSVEHARLTPVFGTSAPLHGASGAVRRLAYRRFSEGRAAHWFL